MGNALTENLLCGIKQLYELQLCKVFQISALQLSKTCIFLGYISGTFEIVIWLITQKDRDKGSNDLEL